MKIQNVLVVLALLSLAGCAGMGTKLDSARASRVKKVVILAVEIHQTQPTDNLKLSRAGDSKARSQSKELKTMAGNIYNNLAKQIKKKTGWQVASQKYVSNNPKYRKFYDAKMRAKIRGTSMSGENVDIIYPKGIIDVYQLRKMSFAERASFARSLGADAFAEYMEYQTIKQPMFSLGHLTGGGSFSFVSRSNLRVFDLKSEDPIWQIQNIDGEKTRSSEEMEGEPLVAKLSTLGQEASQSAVQKLTNNYKR